MSPTFTAHARAPDRAVVHAAARMELEASLLAVQDGSEASGVLIGQWLSHDTVDVTGARALANVAPDPSEGFRLDPEMILRAVRDVADPACVLGFWHTHPSGIAAASVADLRGQERFLSVVPGTLRSERALLIVVPGGIDRWTLRWYRDDGWREVALVAR